MYFGHPRWFEGVSTFTSLMFCYHLVARQLGQNHQPVSKSCTFGSKSGTKSLVRRYQAKFAKTILEYWKVCHIWLKKFKKKIRLVIFFIHIVQLTLFSSEYLSFYLLQVRTAFDPKVHLFENILLKILAQLLGKTGIKIKDTNNGKFREIFPSPITFVTYVNFK